MSPLKMLSPCLNAQRWKKFPLKRIIRLINYSINDLSSFPKSLMIWVSLVFESDPSHWSLKFDVLQSVSSLIRLKLCNRSFCIHALAASVTLPNNFLHWMPIFWHLFSTFMHTWRASVITQTVHESCVLVGTRGCGLQTFLNKVFMNHFEDVYSESGKKGGNGNMNDKACSLICGQKGNACFD